MDTVICGSSAFQYWRTPPIVELLAAGPSDYPGLCRFVDEETLLGFRNDLISSLPLPRACADGPAWRHAGAALKTIRDHQLLLAPAANMPLRVMTDDPKDRRATGIARSMLWKGALPSCSTEQIAEDLEVTTPAFTMLQLAHETSLVKTALMASELCGTYAVFHSPPVIARQLQSMIDGHRLPELDGWRPCLSAGGKLTDLWSRPALIDPSDLVAIAERSDSRNGRSKLLQAAELVKAGAASPFESQAGVLLGFPKRLGGEGLDGFTHNEKVALTPDGRLLAQRDCCYCDLYWPEGLDVECQSAQYHETEGGFLSDSDRTAALRLVGVEVLPLTYAQMKDKGRFDAFVLAVERALGRKHGSKSARQVAASRNLREEAFVNWWNLPTS